MAIASCGPHEIGRDGCDVIQVWGLVRVFGDTNVTYTGAYAVKATYEHWRETKLTDAQRVGMSMHLGEGVMTRTVKGWRVPVSALGHVERTHMTEKVYCAYSPETLRPVLWAAECQNWEGASVHT